MHWIADEWCYTYRTVLSAPPPLRHVRAAQVRNLEGSTEEVCFQYYEQKTAKPVFFFFKTLKACDSNLLDWFLNLAYAFVTARRGHENTKHNWRLFCCKPFPPNTHALAINRTVFERTSACKAENPSSYRISKPSSQLPCLNGRSVFFREKAHSCLVRTMAFQSEPGELCRGLGTVSLCKSLGLQVIWGLSRGDANAALYKMSVAT